MNHHRYTHGSLYTFETFTRFFTKDVRGLPIIVLMMIFSMAIYMFGWGFADPFFSLYLGTFASQYQTIGLFHSLILVASTVALIPVGDLLDRVPQHKLINAAKVLYSVVGIGYFFAGEFSASGVLIGTLFLNGVLTSFVWAGTAATIHSYSTKKNVTLAFGLYESSYHLAWALGLAIALFVVWKFPIHYIFIPVIIFPLLSILPMRKHPDTKRHESISRALYDIVVVDKVFVRFFRDMKAWNVETWMMYLYMFLVTPLQVIAFTFLPLYAQNMGFSTVSVGALVLVMTIPFFVSFLSAEIAYRSERIRNVIAGSGVAALVLAVFPLWDVRDWHVFLLGALLVAGFALMIPSITAIISMTTPKQYNGTTSAALFFTANVSGMIAAPLFGSIVDRFGWEYAFTYAGMMYAAVTCVAVALLYVLKRRNVLYHVNHPASSHNPYIT